MFSYFSFFRPSSSSVSLIDRFIALSIPLVIFLFSISFYLGAYDSAFVKITELQIFITILVGCSLCRIIDADTRLFIQRKKFFTLIMPFLIFFIYGLISFFNSYFSYVTNLDWFLRHCLYFSIVFICLVHIKSLDDLDRIVRMLLFSILVVCVYGVIQWIDVNYYPPGSVSLGIDKFIWRHGFGHRIFSTFGNPNFFSNFLVLMFPIVFFMFYHKKSLYTFVLLCLLVVNIFFTDSKGPIVGLIAELICILFISLRFILMNKKLKMFILGISVAIILILGSYVFYKVTLGGAMQSFSFRIFTWLSTVEMVEEKPWFGYGLGTFWLLYPAYRRPAIFHLEGAHNTESDHPENEHLEVLSDGGIVGFGIWIWMILFLFFVGYRFLVKLSTTDTFHLKGSYSYRVFFYFSGFLVGVVGVLAHNITDVSLRFVSSGIFFWMFFGFIIAILYKYPFHTSFLSLSYDDGMLTHKNDNKLLKFLRIFLKISLLLTVIIVAIRILRQFDFAQGMDKEYNSEMYFHFYVTWIIFFLTWLWFSLNLSVISLKLRKFSSILVLFCIVILLIPFWKFFMAGVFQRHAVRFAKHGIWHRSEKYSDAMFKLPPDQKLIYFGKKEYTDSFIWNYAANTIFPDMHWRAYGIGGVLELYDIIDVYNPKSPLANYLKGNVYNDYGLELSKYSVTNFQNGNIAKSEVYRKNTEKLWNKAIQSYNLTLRYAPNYVQVHYQIGVMNQRLANFLRSLLPIAQRYGREDLVELYKSKILKYYTLAMASHKYYYKIDPVFDLNYYAQSEIYANIGDLHNAKQTLIDFIQAKECKRSYHYLFGGFKQGYVDLSSPHHTHDLVKVKKPEAWIRLGDIFLQEQSYIQAEITYQKAVDVEPHSIRFLEKLAYVYNIQKKDKPYQDILQIIDSVKSKN